MSATLAELKNETQPATCQHLHTATHEAGYIRMYAGDITDTRHEVTTCLDCGKTLVGWYMDGFEPAPEDEDYEEWQKPF